VMWFETVGLRTF